MTTTAKTKKTAKSAKKAAPVEKAEIRVRIDTKLKNKVEKLFKQQGLSTSDGLRLLISRAVSEGDPWAAHKASSHIPNAETQKAFEEARAGDGEVIPLSELKKRILGTK